MPSTPGMVSGGDAQPGTDTTPAQTPPASREPTDLWELSLPSGRTCDFHLYLTTPVRVCLAIRKACQRNAPCRTTKDDTTHTDGLTDISRLREIHGLHEARKFVVRTSQAVYITRTIELLCVCMCVCVRAMSFVYICLSCRDAKLCVHHCSNVDHAAA